MELSELEDQVQLFKYSLHEQFEEIVSLRRQVANHSLRTNSDMLQLLDQEIVSYCEKIKLYNEVLNTTFKNTFSPYVNDRQPLQHWNVELLERADYEFVDGLAPWHFVLKCKDSTKPLRDLEYSMCKYMEFIGPHPVRTHPKRGVLCLCKRERRFFRGMCLGMSSTSRLTMAAIDANETHELDISQVYEIPDSMLRLPPQVVRCCLYTNPFIKMLWSDYFIENFIRVMRRYSFKITVGGMQGQNLPPIYLLESLSAYDLYGEVHDIVKWIKNVITPKVLEYKSAVAEELFEEGSIDSHIWDIVGLELDPDRMIQDPANEENVIDEVAPEDAPEQVEEQLPENLEAEVYDKENLTEAYAEGKYSIEKSRLEILAHEDVPIKEFTSPKPACARNLFPEETAGNSSTVRHPCRDGRRTVEQVSPQESSTSKEVSPQKLSAVKVSIPKYPDEKAFAQKLRDSKVSAQESSDGRVYAQNWKDEKISTKMFLNGKFSAKRLADDKVPTQKAPDGKVSTQKAPDGKVFTQKAPDGKVATQKAPDEKVFTQKASDGKVATQKEPDGKVSTQKAPDEKVFTQKAPDGKVTTQKEPDGKVSTQKAPDGKLSTQKAPDGRAQKSVGKLGISEKLPEHQTKDPFLVYRDPSNLHLHSLPFDAWENNRDLDVLEGSDEEEQVAEILHDVANIGPIYQDEVLLCPEYKRTGTCTRFSCQKEHIYPISPHSVGSVYTYIRTERLLELPEKGSRIHIRPLNIVNGFTFYGILVGLDNPNEPDLELLHQRMQNFVETSRYERLDLLPSLGELVLAFGQLKFWYRARVIEVGECKAKVFALDFGTEEAVPLNRLRKINFDLLFLPPQAVRCHFYGIIPKENFDPAMKEYLKRHILNRILEAEVKIANQADTELELIIYLNGKNLNAHLLQKGLFRRCN